MNCKDTQLILKSSHTICDDNLSQLFFNSQKKTCYSELEKLAKEHFHFLIRRVKEHKKSFIFPLFLHQHAKPLDEEVFNNFFMELNVCILKLDQIAS